MDSGKNGAIKTPDWWEGYDFSHQTDSIQALFGQDPSDVAMQVLILLVGLTCMKNQNDAVKLQLLELDVKNKRLAALNKLLGDLQAEKNKLPSDTKPDAEVTLTDEIKKEMTDLGMDPAKVTNYGELLGAIEQVRSSIDQLNSLSQQDATRLQMGIQQSQVYSDMTTNSMQTFFNSLKGIVRNLV